MSQLPEQLSTHFGSLGISQYISGDYSGPRLVSGVQERGVLVKLEPGDVAAPLSTARLGGYSEFSRVDPILRHLPAPTFVAVKVEVESSTPSEDWPGFPEADYVVIVSGDYDFDVTLSYRDRERLLKTIRTVHASAGAVDTRHHGRG